MGIILHQHHYNKIITGNNINQGSVQQQPGNTQNNSNNTTIPQRQQQNNNSGGSVITRQKIKEGKMKKNILKKTYNLILVCIMLSLVLVGIMGIVYNFNGNLDKIISGYKISDILVPYNEYELIPSAKIVETEAYIDKDGNVIRKVPSKTELGNIDLPKKEEFDEKGNKKKESEKTKTEPVDKEVQEKGYKIEKRQFPENDEKVMNKLGMKKSAEIIVRQLRSEGFENARVSEDEKTGKIVVKVSDELEKGGIFSSSSKKKESSSKEKEAVKSILQTRGTLTVQDPDTGKEYITEENIKAVNILRTENDGAFLEIRLDEKGKKILSEISRKYNIEEKQKEGSNEKTKINHNILIKISEMEVLRAPFAEPNDTGILQLKMLNSEKLKESESKKTIEEALGEVRRLKTALELRKNTYKIYITKHYRKCTSRYINYDFKSYSNSYISNSNINGIIIYLFQRNKRIILYISTYIIYNGCNTVYKIY